MKIFIRSAAAISAQKTFGDVSFLTEPVEYGETRLRAIEPDYKEFIDAKMIRRMSRIIRMGVAASTECLQESGVKIPDAIVTGTAYGCLEDTGLFLGKMVEHQYYTPEEVLLRYPHTSVFDFLTIVCNFIFLL